MDEQRTVAPFGAPPAFRDSLRTTLRADGQSNARIGGEPGTLHGDIIASRAAPAADLATLELRLDGYP